MMMTAVDALNPEQKQVVSHRGSPVVVFAAAGTGKTQALTCRIASLIRDDGVPPEQIVGLTFTRKAAREMRERAAAMAGVSPRQLQHVGTFHSFCLQMLRRFSPRNPVFRRITQCSAHAAAHKSFDVIDPAQVVRRLKHILTEEHMDQRIAEHDKSFMHQKPDDQAKTVCHRIEKWRNDGLMPDEALGTCRTPSDRAYQAVYARYRESCGEDHVLDFSDLILIWTRLLREDHALRQHCRRDLFAHLLLDEAQDINDAQMALVEILCRSRPDDGDAPRLVERNLMVVGDDYQAIHTWRGAKVQNLLDFETRFAGARVIVLGRNYRSLPPILEIADKLIRYNRHQKFKDVTCHRGDGSEEVEEAKRRMIQVQRVEDAWAQADAVARRIKERVAQKSAAAAYSDFVVLYRTHASSQPFEERLRAHDIPYYIKGSVSFFERAEIKMALTILRFCVHQNNVDLEKILSECIKGVGKGTVTALRKEAVATRVVPEAEVCAPKGNGFWRALLGLLLPAADKKKKRSKAMASALEYVEVLRAQVERWEEKDGVRFGDEGMTLAKKIWHVLEDTGYLARLEEMQARERRNRQPQADELDRVGNVNTLLSFIDKSETEKGCTTLPELFDVLLLDVDDVGDDDKEAPHASEEETQRQKRQDRVQLMTLHASKGLEWPYVFIVDCHQDTIPFYCGDLEEERRLMYVAVTRARDGLCCLYPQTRLLFGNRMSTMRSRFLQEMGL